MDNQIDSSPDEQNDLRNAFDDEKIVDFLTYDRNEQKISRKLVNSKSQECIHALKNNKYL
jgi:hypothetical protein